MGRGERWRARAYLLLLGILTGLAQQPLGLAIIYFLTIPLLFRRFAAAETIRAALGIGWWFGLGYFLFVLNWIVQPFMVDIARHGWMAPFALFFMAGGLALFWALAFGLAKTIGRSAGGLLLALAGFWTLVEMLRGIVFTGFPWGYLSYGWIGTPLDQALAIIGPHGLNFMTVLVMAAIGLGFRPAIWGLSALAFVTALGIWRLDQPLPVSDDLLRVRVVQPNATQSQKWDPAWVPVFYERLLELTGAETDEAPDLVILPEMAIVYPLERYPEIGAEIAAAAGTPVILGGHLWLEGEEHVSNGLFLLNEQGSELDRYAKHHLVPFGEYIPFGEFFQQFEIGGLASGLSTGFPPGPGPQVLSAPGLPPFLPLICYEVIFPGEVHSKSREADWLVQITNDGWFGIWTGPYQHLAIAQARSIETGAPLVRSANTGISALIGPRGRIFQSLPLGEAGYFDAELPQRLDPPLYARLGDWPVLFSCLLALAIAMRGRNKGPQRNLG